MERMNLSGHAVSDGRVFVDGKRCTDLDRKLLPGAFVEVFPSTEGGQGDVRVLSWRGDLIAVAKPAGLSTIPDQRGHAASLSHAVAKTAGLDVARVHATSRLDREVSGVVVFALGQGARDEMLTARESHRYRRHYVALSAGSPVPPGGWVDVAIGRGKRPTERKVGGKDPVDARSRYETIDTSGGVGMVAVEPSTGRTHQIRVHMAHLGAALVGDDKYGKSKRLVLVSGAVVRLDRIALHAAWVEIALSTGVLWRVEAPIPSELEDLWARLGGQESCWEQALRPLPPMG
jgi:23S rRNA-/tRNA-specific pseudouridylate synthase